MNTVITGEKQEMSDIKLEGDDVEQVTSLKYQAMYIGYALLKRH